jgi:hypothetical protein
MIEVIIRVKDAVDQPALARIEIENVSGDDFVLADYSVRFGVDKTAEVGLHQRAIYGFPRKKYNVLALLRQALLSLEPEDLELQGSIPDEAHRPRHHLGWRHFFS